MFLFTPHKCFCLLLTSVSVFYLQVFLLTPHRCFCLLLTSVSVYSSQVFLFSIYKCFCLLLTSVSVYSSQVFLLTPHKCFCLFLTSVAVFPQKCCFPLTHSSLLCLQRLGLVLYQFSVSHKSRPGVCLLTSQCLHLLHVSCSASCFSVDVGNSLTTQSCFSVDVGNSLTTQSCSFLLSAVFLLTTQRFLRIDDSVSAFSLPTVQSCVCHFLR